MSKNELVVTKKDLNKTAIRWMLTSVNTYTYSYQQAGSVVFALSPVLRKIYKDDDEYVEALNNHFKFFNSHPWMINLILGATLAMEDQDGIESKDAVQNLKVGLMGPLAGIGDSLIWVLYATIMGSISAYMALEGNMIGGLIWIALNMMFWVFRVKLFHWGYGSGTTMLDKFGENISIVTESLSILGLTIVGALIPSVIKITTPLEFKTGEITTSIQSIFDRILPFFLPVAVTFLIYKIVKTGKVKVSVLIMGLIAVCMLLAGLGIL
jgi:PTS system mannose-specific IID component